MTPQQALQAMLNAGAVFTVKRCDQGGALSFSYRIGAGGDLEKCRRILDAAKCRPAQFMEAFRAEVQRVTS